MLTSQPTRASGRSPISRLLLPSRPRRDLPRLLELGGAVARSHAAPVPRDTQPSVGRSTPGACCDLAGSLEAVRVRELITKQLPFPRRAQLRRQGRWCNARSSTRSTRSPQCGDLLRRSRSNSQRRKASRNERRKRHAATCGFLLGGFVVTSVERHAPTRLFCNRTRSPPRRTARSQLGCLLRMRHDSNTHGGKAVFDESCERHAAASSFQLGRIVVALAKRHTAPRLFLGHDVRLREGSDSASFATRSEGHLGECIGDRAVLPDGRWWMFLEPRTHLPSIVTPQARPPCIPVVVPRHPARSFRSLTSTLSSALTAPGSRVRLSPTSALLDASIRMSAARS